MSLKAGRPSKAAPQKSLKDMATPKTVRVNFEMDAEEYQALKVFCATEKISVRDFFISLFAWDGDFLRLSDCRIHMEGVRQLKKRQQQENEAKQLDIED